jgi:DNA-binding NarL/FixJ family response regulator
VAATEVERARLDAGPAPAVDGPDLDGALRPAIARSSERVAEALVALDAPVDAGTARAATQDGVRSVALSPTTLDRIADAIAACARGAVP